MPATHFQLILAAGWEEIIVPAIVIIGWLISALASGKKQDEEDASSPAKPEALQDETERRERRRKLQEMAGEQPKTFRELVATIKKQLEASENPAEPVVLAPQPVKPQLTIQPKAKPKPDVKAIPKAAVKPGPRTTMKPAPGRPGHDTDETVHRHVPDVPSVESPFSRRRYNLQGFSRSQLQKAWVLREVLGPPAALKDDTLPNG